jgi:glycosyltransferase involved in cell wall biosynthesis
MCVSVPITAFPVAGGQRSVLAGVEKAMAGVWDMEYLTQHVGPDAEKHVIYAFGDRSSTPWQFPNILAYERAGRKKLRELLRGGHSYGAILPQDGVYSGAFSALVGKAIGVRVVCMDHGTLTLPYNSAYREERAAALRRAPFPRRVISRLRFIPYWPLLRRLARITAQHTDCFLVSGADVEERLRKLGVPPTRIMRYPYMIDIDRFRPFTDDERVETRARRGTPADAILISLACRLAPEKGFDVAIPALAQLVARAPADVRERIAIVIAGDGPSRGQIEADIRALHLERYCTFWGEVGPDDVAQLLGISDVFLYASTRGAGLPMAVLEAMSAGCAVVAARQPESLGRVLAEGRGMSIPAEDVAAACDALVQVCAGEDSRRSMGAHARDYIMERHSDVALRRSLLRAVGWSPALQLSARRNEQYTSPRAEQDGDRNE